MSYYKHLCSIEAVFENGIFTVSQEELGDRMGREKEWVLLSITVSLCFRTFLNQKCKQ